MKITGINFNITPHTFNNTQYLSHNTEKINFCGDSFTGNQNYVAGTGTRSDFFVSKYINDKTDEDFFAEYADNINKPVINAILSDPHINEEYYKYYADTIFNIDKEGERQMFKNIVMSELNGNGDFSSEQIECEANILYSQFRIFRAEKQLEILNLIRHGELNVDYDYLPSLLRHVSVYNSDLTVKLMRDGFLTTRAIDRIAKASKYWVELANAISVKYDKLSKLDDTTEFVIKFLQYTGLKPTPEYSNWLPSDYIS